MSECRHGTDLDDSDCINCEYDAEAADNAVDSILEAIKFRHEIGQMPSRHEIKVIIDKFADHYLSEF